MLAAASADKEEMISAILDLDKIQHDRACDVHNIFRDRKPHLYGLLCKPIDEQSDHNRTTQSYLGIDVALRKTFLHGIEDSDHLYIKLATISSSNNGVMVN